MKCLSPGLGWANGADGSTSALFKDPGCTDYLRNQFRLNTLKENHASEYIVTKTKQSYACIKVGEKGVRPYFEFSMSH